MEAFDERLREAVRTYRRLQSSEDGGWSEDRTAGAARSIVNTCEVLTVLHVAGVPYDDEAVQRGLAYLAEKVFVHPRRPVDDEDEGRGAKTRYFAWSLRGLGLWAEGSRDPRWRAAQQHCVDWLVRNECRRQLVRGVEPIGGAWKEHERNQTISLLSTATAIAALARVAGDYELIDRAAAMATRARAEVARAAQVARDTAWWPQVPGERQASPAATALAILALADGDAGQRALACRGIRWLLGHVSRWENAVEGDSLARGSNWTHMTFSLCVRAMLAPCGGQRADQKSLRGVVDHLDDLWLPEHGEWSHGKPGARPSPSGSCAVVLAHEALRRAWPFDAAGQMPRRRRPPQTRPRVAQFEVNVMPDYSVAVRDLDGKVILSHRLGPAGSRLFAMLAVRHYRGDPTALDTRSVPTGDLARALGIKLDSVRTSTGRINRALTAVAQTQGNHVGDLVQDMQAKGPTKRSWYVNVDRVVVAANVVREVDRLLGGGQPASPSADMLVELSADKS